MPGNDSYTKGLKKMKEMGREDTMLNQRKISEDMYQLSVGALFGDIWNRPHLSLRDRQLITMAANIALARPHGTQWLLVSFDWKTPKEMSSFAFLLQRKQVAAVRSTHCTMLV